MITNQIPTEGYALIHEVQERYIEMLSWFEVLKQQSTLLPLLLETIVEELQACQV